MTTNIKLTDSQGRTIQKRDLHKGRLEEFEVSSLNGGNYIVELNMPNGKTIRHQFSLLQN